MYDKLRKIREERAEGDRGFTLIELLVVVVIIGILIAIAIPLYLNYQKGAKDKSAQSDLKAAVTAIQQCYTDNSNMYPTAIAVASNVGTPADAACSKDVVNLSSGTTFTYTPSPSGCDNAAAATACVSFVATTTNSGGSGKTYTYDSTKGGQIG